METEVAHPEHAIHTWRDFLIHMGTVCLGLLLALGLEQSVEALHRHHERLQLEEDVRAEAEHNVAILQKHLDVNIPNLLYYRNELIAVRSAAVHNGFVDVTLPVRHNPGGIMTAPERNVWPVSKSSGTIALLPEAEAQAFARVDYQAEEDEKMVDKIRSASAEISQFQLVSGVTLRPGAALHLTSAQRDQLVAAYAQEADTLHALLVRDNEYMIECQGIVSGIRDVDTLNRYRWEQEEKHWVVPS
jgi:hypothetical protein